MLHLTNIQLIKLEPNDLLRESVFYGIFIAYLLLRILLKMVSILIDFDMPYLDFFIRNCLKYDL